MNRRFLRANGVTEDLVEDAVSRVLADGRFTPGVYAHTHNAALIYRDVKAIYEAGGRTDDPPFW